MFSQLGEEEESTQQPIGVSIQEAGEIASGNAVRIAVASVVMFYLIYRFLGK